MFSLGLTSVTFRHLDFRQIPACCAQAGLSCIEWGGDVHVPPATPDRAVQAARLTAAAGLRVSSYGSYYRCGETDDAQAAFAPHLEAARRLGAPVIRLWAGSRGSSDADSVYFRQIVEETRALCRMAAKENITMAFEYHPHTLTDHADAAVRLAESVGMTNCGLYFQVDPTLSAQENRRALRRLLPFLKKVHVYHCDPAFRRLSLGESGGPELWRALLAELETASVCTDLLFEFLKDPTPEGLFREAELLRSLL